MYQCFRVGVITPVKVISLPSVPYIKSKALCTTERNTIGDLNQIFIYSNKRII